jgi:uncharacterized protein
VTITSSGDFDRVIVDRHVECEMRDGTILRADVYRPDDESRPVLVHRIPYNRQNPMSLTNSMFPPMLAASRGYAVVVQDTRGRFGSDGRFQPFSQEGDDGYDTIEWAANQPWSNGKVGIYGSSYMGVTSLQAVAAAPPHLVTAIAYLTGGNYQDGWVYTGGAFEWLFNLRWAAGPAASELHRLGADEESAQTMRRRLEWIVHEPEEALWHTPTSDVFGEAGEAIPFWGEWMENPEYGPYWEAVDLTRSLVGSTIPTLNVAGWYDPFLFGQLQTWRALRQEGGADVGHELMIGPWDHEAYQSVRSNAAGDRFFGPTAVGGASGLGRVFLGWFDRHLKGTPAEAESAPVRFFHMGPDHWAPAAAWPPTNQGSTLYLRSGGAANTRRGDGLLNAAPPDEDTVDSYLYDPHHPVPTRGGRHLGFRYGRAGVQDQSDVELRDDVLVFTGASLTEPLDVVGAVRLVLHVRSSSPTTDFTAKLVDVAPDGYCANVAEGIRRVSETDGDLRGEGPLEVSIDLWDTAYRFDTGHRVRLEVSSSNFPRFDRNGNVPGNPSTIPESEWVIAAQQVWSGPKFPARLMLGGDGSE